MTEPAKLLEAPEPQRRRLAGAVVEEVMSVLDAGEEPVPAAIAGSPRRTGPRWSMNPRSSRGRNAGT
jgi:hypothetical protein